MLLVAMPGAPRSVLVDGVRGGYINSDSERAELFLASGNSGRRTGGTGRGCKGCDLDHFVKQT